MATRSVFTCSTKHGVCKYCYRRSLATGFDVKVGKAVGTIAAQSIGEPGIQLTTHTLRTGGVVRDDITRGLPRVQEIFKARNPRGQAVITEVTGDIIDISEDPATRTKEVIIKGKTDTRTYTVPYTVRMKIAEDDMIRCGAPLTEGSIGPKQLLQAHDVLSVENYLLREVQRVYRMQGVKIGDKHIEVMVRQVPRKVRVTDPGDTNILPGTLLDIVNFKNQNYNVLVSGGVPAASQPVLLGITKASLETNSFLSVASFQETARVSTDAAIYGKKDLLPGLKENVVTGKIIPASIGMQRYRNMKSKEVGAANENVYSISDIEAQMTAEDAVNNQTKQRL